MIKYAYKLAGGAAALLTLAATAFADIKINDNITFSGFAAGAYMNYKASGFPAVDSLFDASKPIPGGGDANEVLTKFTLNYKPVTGVISLNYFPNLPTSEFTILDAYVTYDAGSGSSFTLGKFLSYLGYESFYAASMDQISYATGDFLAPIPGYHTGVRYDYSDKVQSFGLAVVDSVYSPYGGTRGDGEWQHNGGFEAFYSYIGITDVTLWAGVAFDTKGGFQPHSVTTLDFWASYNISKAARVAAEYVHKDGGTGNKGYNWLAFLDYSFTDTVSCAFRVSGEKMSDFTTTDDEEDTVSVSGPSFVKYTICPAVALTPNLKLRAEYSHYAYSDYVTSNANFYGVQVVFTF
jgi:hypothetical protein